MKLRSAIDDLHDTTVEALDGSLRRLEYFGGLRSKEKEKKKDGEYQHWGLSRTHGDLPAMKALALLLYAMGNVSFGSIARLLGVSDAAVLNWVRDEARKLPEPSTKADVVVVTLDEMWHFVKKRLKNCGFGEPMTLWLGEPSPGFLVAVMTPHAKCSSTKSASKAKRSSQMIGRATTV